MMDVFENAPSVSLREILDNREWRACRQEELIQKFLKSTVVSIKLNIPGNIKSTKILSNIFENRLEGLIKGSLDFYVYKERITGPEAFVIFNKGLTEMKKKMIHFEETDLLGRLFDIDLTSGDNQGKQLSRTDLGFPERSCYICSESAKECARSKKHSMDEIKFVINRMIENAK
ncbi:MAG: citrate lyase holo-[acyl-carrier protein] synthase [Lactovum sp.]